MAEAFNSLYKWELIYPQGPWRGLDDVEFATLGYIDWFNHRRLHGEITDDNSYVTPAEFEATYYRQAAPALEAVTQTSDKSRNPGRFTHCSSNRAASETNLSGFLIQPLPMPLLAFRRAELGHWALGIGQGNDSLAHLDGRE
jgi:hypothetical protein